MQFQKKGKRNKRERGGGRGRRRRKQDLKSLLNSKENRSLSPPLTLFLMSALSPAMIASAAVAVARAAREYLGALSDAESTAMT